MFDLCSDEWASALGMCEMSPDGSCQTRTLQMVKNKPNNPLWWFCKWHVQNSTSGLLRLSDWKVFYNSPLFKAFDANYRTISRYTPIENWNVYISLIMWILEVETPQPKIAINGAVEGPSCDVRVVLSCHAPSPRRVYGQCASGGSLSKQSTWMMAV